MPRIGDPLPVASSSAFPSREPSKSSKNVKPAGLMLSLYVVVYHITLERRDYDKKEVNEPSTRVTLGLIK